MNLRALFVSGFISAAMVAFAAPRSGTPVHECVPGTPTVASYTWDFKGEANTIFQDIESDADQALDHADKLQTFALESGLDWETHAEQLDALRDEVNDMGTKLCRLETIRRVVAPWQQAEIDRIATTARLMAVNTEDAIQFLNGHQGELWLAEYRTDTNHIFEEAQTLAHSVRTAVAYANASKDYRNLRRELGMASSS